MKTIVSIAVGVVALGPLFGTLAGAAPVQPQTRTEIDLSRLGDGKAARVINRALTVGREDGRTVARLDARPGDGSVILEEFFVADGVIEVELRGRDVAQQSFLGVSFHAVDSTTFDAVYFRPFNFRAATAEARSHAVQYVSHPTYTWQKLRAERAGQFEQAIDPAPDPNGWFRARIVLAKGRVEVYVNGASAPVLSVEDLGEAKSGGVGLFVGNNSDGTFANLAITPTSPATPPPPSTETIFQAARTGNLARVRTLVEADPKAASAREGLGHTPLHFAAMSGHLPTVEYLIAHGTDVNAVARHSGTPLDVAAEADQQEVVKLLESRGARLTPFRFEVTPLSPSIHQLFIPWGMMNNIVVVATGDGAVIIDTGFSWRGVEALRKAVGDVAKGGVRYVISSHGHGDHVAGNAIAPSPEAILSAETLASHPERFSITRAAAPLSGPKGRTLPAPYLWRVGGTDIRLIHRPGLHSPADLITWFPADRVVAMGDLLLSESMPALTDIAGYLSFLDDVLDVFPPDTRFLSGHGRVLDAAGVKAYRDALVEIIGIVRTNKAAGRTVAQMIADDVLRDYTPRFGLLDFLVPNRFLPTVAKALEEGQIK